MLSKRTLAWTFSVLMLSCSLATISAEIPPETHVLEPSFKLNQVGFIASTSTTSVVQKVESIPSVQLPSFELQSVSPPGRLAVAVLQVAENPESWIRVIDETGTMGPILRFGEHFWGAFSIKNHPEIVFITSDGAKLCVSDEQGQRQCDLIAPQTLVATDNQVFGLSLIKVTNTKRKPMYEVQLWQLSPVKSAAAVSSKLRLQLKNGVRDFVGAVGRANSIEVGWIEYEKGKKKKWISESILENGTVVARSRKISSQEFSKNVFNKHMNFVYPFSAKQDFSNLTTGSWMWSLNQAGSLQKKSLKDGTVYEEPHPFRDIVSAANSNVWSIPLNIYSNKATQCAVDMVNVGGQFCMDRYEAMLTDINTSRKVSPFYPLSVNSLKLAFEHWNTERQQVGNVHAQAMPLPTFPEWQMATPMRIVATAYAGVLPNGYVSGDQAEMICQNSGKRLCTRDEFKTACRSEKNTQFPYGDSYRVGVCNVFRDAHPAMVLHDDASIGHLDPRLGLVVSNARTLLLPTGSQSECKSAWGEDAIYDLVGNLDEWVEGGAFAGGFYSRATRSGCDAIVTSHLKNYLDYSTGVRCCSDLKEE